MTDRDPMIDAIHVAGEVPPPPDRDAAFARAMQPVLMPSRRRLSRSFIALFAAALLAAPAAVFAAHVTHTHAALDTPIVSEHPDPGSSIHSEADDATLRRLISQSHETDHQVAKVTSSDEQGTVISGGDDHPGSAPSPAPSDDSSNRGPGGGDDHPSVSPTPTGSADSGGSGGASISPTGGSPDGSPGGVTPGPN